MAKLGCGLRNVGCYLLLTVLFAAGSQPVAAQGIRWHHDLATAQREAAATNRLVLAHFWATWCGPCMEMEREVFNQPEVVRAMQANYVPVKINIDEQPEVMKRLLKVHKIPADVVMTPDGRILSATRGKIKAPLYKNQLDQIAAVSRQGAPAESLQAEEGQTVSATPPEQLAQNQPGYGTRQVAAQEVSPPASPVGSRYQNYQPQQDWAQPQPPAQQPAAPQQPPVQQQVQAQPQPPAQPANAQPYGSNPTYASNPNGSPVGQRPLVGTPTNQAPAGVMPPSQPPVARQPVTPPAAQPAAPVPGLDGYCPVQLAENKQWIKADPRFGAFHHGKLYLFAGQEEFRRFMADPNRYAPVAAGEDPVFSLDLGRSVPGKREFGVFYEGRIYLFASEETLDKFSQSPERYTAEAIQARRNK